MATAFHHGWLREKGKALSLGKIKLQMQSPYTGQLQVCLHLDWQPWRELEKNNTQYQRKVKSSYHGFQWEIFGSCGISDPSVYGMLFHTFATLVLSDGLLSPTYVSIYITQWAQLYTSYCCFSSPLLLVYTARPANFSYTIFQSELVSPEDHVSTPWISVLISLLTILRKKSLPKGIPISNTSPTQLSSFQHNPGGPTQPLHSLGA